MDSWRGHKLMASYLNALKAANRLRCVQNLSAWRLRVAFWAASLMALNAADIC